MKTFVFILTVWAMDTPPEVSIEDFNLTGADCVQAMENYAKNDPEFSRGIPSCEFEYYDQEVPYLY